MSVEKRTSHDTRLWKDFAPDLEAYLDGKLGEEAERSVICVRNTSRP
jgi:hypothetical protein